VDPAVVRWNDVARDGPVRGARVGAGRVGDGVGAEAAHAGAPGDQAAALQPAHRGGVRRVGAPLRAVFGAASSVGAGGGRCRAIPVESSRDGSERDHPEPGRERPAVPVRGSVAATVRASGRDRACEGARAGARGAHSRRSPGGTGPDAGHAAARSAAPVWVRVAGVGGADAAGEGHRFRAGGDRGAAGEGCAGPCYDATRPRAPAARGASGAGRAAVPGGCGARSGFRGAPWGARAQAAWRGTGVGVAVGVPGGAPAS